MDTLDTPDKRQQWIAAARGQGNGDSQRRRAERFEKHLGEERAEATLAVLQRQTDRQRAVRDDCERRLNPVELSILRPFVEQTTAQFTRTPGNPRELVSVSNVVTDADVEGGGGTVVHDGGEDPDKMALGMGVAFACVIAQWPLVWFPLFALVSRGGIARWIAGLAFVRRDGRPASVWVCWLRAVLAWLPLLGVLLAVIALQVYQPYWVYTRTVLWLFGIVLLGLMVFAALRRPDQTPLDRLFRLYIVPA